MDNLCIFPRIIHVYVARGLSIMGFPMAVDIYHSHSPCVNSSICMGKMFYLDQVRLIRGTIQYSDESTHLVLILYGAIYIERGPRALR